ncbi:Lactose transport system permease protein LacG [Streptomyces glaucescens]
MTLLLGALYCLLPVAWVVIASTKSGNELFSTFTFLPGTGFAENLSDLNAYRDGVYWQWMGNSALYAIRALLSTVVSSFAGYALATYRFRGRETMFNVLLAGVLMPPVILAIPQYLLLAKADLTDSYWSVLAAADPLAVRRLPVPDLRGRRRCRPTWWRPGGWTARASGGSSPGSRCR